MIGLFGLFLLTKFVKVLTPVLAGICFQGIYLLLRGRRKPFLLQFPSPVSCHSSYGAGWGEQDFFLGIFCLQCLGFDTGFSRTMIFFAVCSPVDEFSITLKSQCNQYGFHRQSYSSASEPTHNNSHSVLIYQKKKKTLTAESMLAHHVVLLDLGTRHFGKSRESLETFVKIFHWLRRADICVRQCGMYIIKG